MSPDTPHIIQNKNSFGELIAQDIVYIHYKADTYLELEDFQIGAETYITLSEGKKMKALVEIGQFSTASLSARKFAQEHNPATTAEAIVVHSLAQRILARFYMLFRQKNHPIRIFEDKEHALEWLISL